MQVVKLTKVESPRYRSEVLYMLNVVVGLDLLQSCSFPTMMARRPCGC